MRENRYQRLHKATEWIHETWEHALHFVLHAPETFLHIKLHALHVVQIAT